MKLPWRRKIDELKQRFLLTPEEKRVIVFVFAAFFIGLGAKCYRNSHPQSPVKIDKKQAYSRAHRISPSPTPFR